MPPGVVALGLVLAVAWALFGLRRMARAEGLALAGWCLWTAVCLVAALSDLAQLWPSWAGK